MKLNKGQVDALRDTFKIQNSDGNWNYDEHMFGMLIGMEFFLSIIEDRKADYREKPEVWLRDIVVDEKPIASTEAYHLN